MNCCPRCRQLGRSVSLATVRCNSLPHLVPNIDEHHQWRVCMSDGTCSVVYFCGDDVITYRQVTRVPFHKNGGVERSVCFCFGHTESEIVEDVRRNGDSSIRRSIIEACRRGQDDCEKLNPAGRCCLANVTMIINRLLQGDDGSPECCASAEGCAASSNRGVSS